MNFYSKHKELVVSVGKDLLKFHNGVYSTEDEETIRRLKSHKAFNRPGIGQFTALPEDRAKSTTQVIKGVRGGGSHELSEVQKYEELKKEVVHIDGNKYKVRAAKTRIKEFEDLHKKLYGIDFEFPEE